MRPIPALNIHGSATPILCGLILSGGLWLSAPAHAQDQSRAQASARPGAVVGLRTLTWPGKPTAAERAAVVASQPASAPTPNAVSEPAPVAAPVARTETRYSGTPGHAPYVAPGRRNELTPASAFYAPPAPVYAPSAVAPAAPQFAPQPESAPRQPAPPPPPPVAAAVEAEAHDPMAPRLDAPIFRMQAPAPVQPPAQAEASNAEAAAVPAPAAQGARYYSVHRAAGRQPDPTTLPAPFFLDAAPVDLAEPPPPPVHVRQGGLHPALSDTPL